MAHVFFDLDGTLTDSAEGITRCIAHAVRELGGEPRPRAKLVRYIGTGLSEIFAELMATDDASTIERAVELYVERFRRRGIRENRLYPGVEVALSSLRAAGHFLHVATAKTQSAADEVIDLFSLRGHFLGVHGVHSERGASKGDMLARVLAEGDFDPGACFMVGDRHHDVAAAVENGMQSVWADWGYGSAAERDRAEPNHVVSGFDELVALITGELAKAPC